MNEPRALCALALLLKSQLGGVFRSSFPFDFAWISDVFAFTSFPTN